MDIRSILGKRDLVAPKEVNPNQKKANVIVMNRWNTRNRFEQCSRERVRR